MQTRHVLIAAACALVLLGVTWQRCGIMGCPKVARLTAYQPDGATLLLDRNGKRFADLAPVRYQVVALNKLPKHVPQAFLAVEDKRFYDHNGVDWKRVLGAVLANVKARGFAQGSSTITMQLARNLFPKQLPGQERSVRRKLLEVRVARAIERKFEKDEILELYLNHIYFGNGAYGIEAAAQQYYKKPAKDLLLSQAAMLAALPKAPAHYDPRRRATRAKERRNLVLALMLAQDRITAKEAAGARGAALRVSSKPRRGSNDDGFAPYYVDVIRRMMEDRFGDAVYERRLKVFTTLDTRAQGAAEEEVSRQLRTLEAGALGRLNGPKYASAGSSDEDGTRYVQGAAVVVDVRTGDVRALVGGRDFLDSPFNRVTQSQRQIGSAFKPFVYASALNEGFFPSQHIPDLPIRREMSRTVVWEPRNYDGEFYGQVSMRQALIESRNVPTINIADAVGLDDVKATALKAGIKGELSTHPSMSLGTVATSPIDLALAYTVFPGLGRRPEEARFVVRVEDEDGDVLWSTEPKITGDAMDPRVAYVITHMLRDAVNHGTGTGVRSAGYYAAAAGKTGTTNDGTDAWFVGYTPELVGAVWIGFDQRRAITGNASGGRLAAPVWGRIMRRYYADNRDPGDFEVPNGVVHRNVDPETGLILESGCWPRYEEPASEIFIEGTEPETVCPSDGGVLGWITGALRGLGRTVENQTHVLEDVFKRAESVHPQARELLEKFIERTMREGVVSSEELRHEAEDWLHDFERQLRYEKERALRKRRGR
ncbi:MAG: PBP1A family penicillin-binding protein [Gemmatimonadota bacterium]